jgi:hypothetical protein
MYEIFFWEERKNLERYLEDVEDIRVKFKGKFLWYMLNTFYLLITYHSLSFLFFIN